VYRDGGKTVPVATGGQWEIRPAAEFAKPRGYVDLSYYFQPANRLGNAESVGKVEVDYQLSFHAEESTTDLYYVAGWEVDGRLTEVTVRRLMNVESGNVAWKPGFLSIKTTDSHGFLRVYVMQDGKSLCSVAPAEMEFVAVRAAIDAGDVAAVTNWLNGPGRNRSLPRSLFLPIARLGDAALLELALSGPGAKHVKGDEGRSLLLATAETGRENCVILLLRLGVSANAAGGDDRTALARAVLAGSKPVVLALLAAGADPERYSGSDFNRTREGAFKSGNAELTKLLLDRGLKMPDAGELEDYFLDAVQNGQVDMVGLILQRAKNPRPLLNRPVLLLAALHSDHAMLKLLLGAGTKPNVPGPKGETAIMDAAYVGDAEAVALLKEAGASLTLSDPENHTAAGWALKGGHSDLALELLKQAPLSDPAASRLLQDAVAANQPELVAVSLAQGASVELATGDVDAVLAGIIRAGNLQVLDRALERGVDVSRVICRDWNLAGLAQRYHQPEVTAFLTKRAGHPPEVHQPVAVKLPVQIFSRGPLPNAAETGDGSPNGEAQVDVYIDADGVPFAPLLRSASNEKVGRASLANIIQWRFNKISNPGRPWRRIAVPLEFSAVNSVDRVHSGWDIDERPALKDPGTVTDTATQVRNAAWMRFTVSATGAVISPRVLSVTSPGLEDAALRQVSQLKFYPARQNQTNVAYEQEGVLLLPAGVMISPNRFTCLGRENIELEIKVGSSFDPHLKDLDATQSRAMVLATMVVDVKGSVKQVNFIGSPAPQYAKQARKLCDALQFKPLVINEAATETSAIFALVFGRSDDH